MILSMVSFYTA